jgi:hypothetical protein
MSDSVSGQRSLERISASARTARRSLSKRTPSRSKMTRSKRLTSPRLCRLDGGRMTGTVPERRPRRHQGGGRGSPLGTCRQPSPLVFPPPVTSVSPVSGSGQVSESAATPAGTLRSGTEWTLTGCAKRATDLAGASANPVERSVEPIRRTRTAGRSSPTGSWPCRPRRRSPSIRP